MTKRLKIAKTFFSRERIPLNRLSVLAPATPIYFLAPATQAIVILAAVTICFPPEKPRDIALIYPGSILERAKRWWLP